MKTTYRVPTLGVIVWYALVIAIGILFLAGIRTIPHVPAFLQGFFWLLIVGALIAPLSETGGSVAVEEKGLRQKLLFSSWFIPWDAIESWSCVELLITGGYSADWTPYLFVRMKGDERIYSPHPWIVWGQRVHELAEAIRQQCGPAEAGFPPLIPNSFRHAKWRIPEGFGPSVPADRPDL